MEKSEIKKNFTTGLIGITVCLRIVFSGFRSAKYCFLDNKHIAPSVNKLEALPPLQLMLCAHMDINGYVVQYNPREN